MLEYPVWLVTCMAPADLSLVQLLILVSLGVGLMCVVVMYRNCLYLSLAHLLG